MWVANLARRAAIWTDAGFGMEYHRADATNHPLTKDARSLRSRFQPDVRFQGLIAAGAAALALVVVATLALTLLSDTDDSAEDLPSATVLALATVPVGGNAATPEPSVISDGPSPTVTAEATPLYDPERDKWGVVVESISEDDDVQVYRSSIARTGFVDDRSIDERPGVAWTVSLGDQNFSVPAIRGNDLVIGGNTGILTCYDVGTGEVLWEFETRDSISSSPAIGHNRVFVGSFDGNFYAVDLDNGRREWRFETAGPIHSSPAVDGQVVYFGGYDRVVYALSVIDGTLVWAAPTGAEIESSPAVSGEFVFIGSNDGYLYALDRLTGKRQWRVNTGGPVKSTPAVLEDVVYIASESGSVMAIAVADGDVIWTFDTESAISYSSPAIENNTVVIGTEAGIVFGIRADNGRERWRFQTDAEVRASATVVDRVVYIGSYDENLYALALNTGELLWSTDRGGVVGSPVFDDGTIYVSISAGELQALRPE